MGQCITHLKHNKASSCTLDTQSNLMVMEFSSHTIMLQCQNQIRLYLDVVPFHCCTHALTTRVPTLLQVDSSFNFADFVTDFLTEEFARVVKLEFLMWIIAIIWIAIPAGAYAGFWMTGFFFLLSVVAGAKLHVIAMSLARHAYSLYFRPISGGGGPPSSGDISVRIGSGARAGGEPVEVESAGVKKSLGLFRKSAVAVPQQEYAARAAAGPVGEAAESPEHDGARFAADAGSGAPAELMTVMEVPEESGAFRGTSGRRSGLGIQRSRSESEIPRLSEDKPGSPLAGQRGVRLPDATSSSNNSRQPSNRVAKSQAGAQARRDAVPPGGCLSCGAPQPSRSGLTRRSAQVKPWRDVDFKELFWFRRPRLMLRIFQYAYFENALSLAVLAFAFWQHESSIFAGVVGDKSEMQRSTLIAACVFIALDVALLVHSSCFVLPVYALTAAAANFDTPEGLLEFAKKRGIRPDIVEFLEETHPTVRPSCACPGVAAVADTAGAAVAAQSSAHGVSRMCRRTPVILRHMQNAEHSCVLHYA